jgi:hypothetical protein
MDAGLPAAPVEIYEISSDSAEDTGILEGMDDLQAIEQMINNGHNLVEPKKEPTEHVACQTDSDVILVDESNGIDDHSQNPKKRPCKRIRKVKKKMRGSSTSPLPSKKDYHDDDDREDISQTGYEFDRDTGVTSPRSLNGRHASPVFGGKTGRAGRHRLRSAQPKAQGIAPSPSTSAQPKAQGIAPSPSTSQTVSKILIIFLFFLVYIVLASCRGFNKYTLYLCRYHCI